MEKKTLVIGTRGSKLALWQANYVADLLRAANPGLEVKLKIIKTTGDRIQDRPLYEVGGKGLFVKEIEEALLDKSADLAVHSMKDVPAGFPDGLGLIGMLTRASPFDALISRDGSTKLDDLPTGAVVATSSLRRASQLRAHRPDLKIVSIRGNVDTRLRKLADGVDDMAATMLAVAGLERLGWGEHITEQLVPPTLIPAIGQGAIGLEARIGDAATLALVEPVLDADTWTCVRAERGVLEALNGDCHLPIAAYAVLDGGVVKLRARILSADGTNVVEGSIEGPRAEANALGHALAKELLGKGGRELLDSL